MTFRILLSLALLASFTVTASNGYYRFPAIHLDTVVFTAEGDLWVNRLGQNQAKRLTTHTAEEKHAAISPDGNQVAYIANYDGSADVYVIPLSGGIAKRVSFENGLALVHGWTSDGKVLYSTNGRIGAPRNWTLKTVDVDSFVTTDVAVADAREGVIDRSNRYVYFSQFGTANYNDNVRKYRGGALGEIWRYELGSSNEAQKLTDKHVGNARQPMVYKNKVYFISDADGVDNLWQMSTDGTKFKQLTHYKDWPVRSARLHGGKIIYQLGADLKVLTLRSNKSRLLKINLTSDFPNLRERWLPNPLRYTTNMRFNGEQEKVVITARGRVAVAGTDGSRLVEITTPLDSRTRGAVLSHDGKWVYAINDASGEQEIWRFAADGSGLQKQLTKDGSIYRYSLSLSPDGKHIVHDDKNGALWLLSLETLDNEKLTSHADGFIPYKDIVWSADSRLLALSARGKHQPRSQISLYDLQTRKLYPLTSSKFESFSPTFSPDGDWLYFLSERHFSAGGGSPWVDRNMGPVFDRRVQIFAYSLNSQAQFGFQTPNELMAEQNAKAKNHKEEKKPKLVEWAGIKRRLWQVRVPPGNYWNLQANDGYLYVLDRATEPGARSFLKSIEIAPLPTLEVFTHNVFDYQLADEGKTMFVRRASNGNRSLYIVKAKDKFPKQLKDNLVLTRDWEMRLQPALEWRQMFHDAWLQHRDSLFDKNLRGVDWPGVERKYSALLGRLTDRWELNDLLAQMVGEVNTLHSQIRPGDTPVPNNRPRQANLAAQLAQTASGIKIDKIYQHDPEMPWRASALGQPGVNAKNGDIIEAVNGKRVTTIAQLIAALRNQAGKQVLLTLKRDGQSHRTVVVPVNSFDDQRMRYKHWVNENREKVEDSNDKLGYLHLAAMGTRDINSFAETFFANLHKQGLIIDVRRNRGGNIDSWLIERLMAKAWEFWRISETYAQTNPQQAYRGHLVVLADQGTYSDGETFTAAIKALKLGTVIGKRTAGAGIFLSDGNALSDFGMARVSEIPQFAIDGRWLIEGHGVAPDIEIDNLPHATFKGEDAQLDKAISVLLEKLKSKPIQELKGKPFPANGTPAEDI